MIVTGANSGMVLHKALLAMTIKVPTSDGEGPKKEVRCMTLPVVLYTRTGAVTVWSNLNTTTVPGEILAAFFHSRIK